MPVAPPLNQSWTRIASSSAYPFRPVPYNEAFAMLATLDQILATTRRKLSQKRRAADLRALDRLAAEHKPRGFRNALTSAASQGVAVIAELKKASPSRGLIRPEFDPSQLARELEQGSAAALSVRSEEHTSE